MEERRYRRLGYHHHNDCISQWCYPCQRFVNCGGKDTRQCPRSITSEETKSWAKAESNRDPFSYQPSWLALGQTSPPGRGRSSDWGRNTAHSIQRTYVTKVDERLRGMVTDTYVLMYAARRGYCALNTITNYSCNPSDSYFQVLRHSWWLHSRLAFLLHTPMIVSSSVSTSSSLESALTKSQHALNVVSFFSGIVAARRVTG